MAQPVAPYYSGHSITAHGGLVAVPQAMRGQAAGRLL